MGPSRGQEGNLNASEHRVHKVYNHSFIEAQFRSAGSVNQADPSTYRVRIHTATASAREVGVATKVVNLVSVESTAQKIETFLRWRTSNERGDKCRIEVVVLHIFL